MRAKRLRKQPSWPVYVRDTLPSAMNRRGFFNRLLGAAVATAAASVPWTRSDVLETVTDEPITMTATWDDSILWVLQDGRSFKVNQRDGTITEIF